MSAGRSIADLSADLADRAESFCRQYFPEGRKQGNYWQVGDASGAKGQSLAIRLHAQGGRKAGSWQDFATGQYGDLIDLLQERLGSVTLKETLREARSFLGEAPALPSLVNPETLNARMQPPANASRGRANSLPLASRFLAHPPPLICKGAASRGSARPFAITPRSFCGTARMRTLRRKGPLPCSRRSPTIGARSSAARAPIWTRPPAGWP